MFTIPTLQKPDQIADGSRVAIYGSGLRGKTLKSAIATWDKDISMVCFVDSFTPGRVDGYDVVTQQSLAEDLREGVDLILIASAFEDEIVKGLDDRLVEKTAIAGARLTDAYLEAIGEKALYTSMGLETTTFCNMACEFCRHPVSPRKNRHMDFEILESVVRDARELNLADEVTIPMMGEPLMYPRCNDAVALCKENGFKVQLMTNGLLLTPDRYEELVGLGVDRLYFSFHEFTEEGFQYRHPKNGMSYADFRQRMFDILERHMEKRLENRLDITLTFSKASDPISALWGFEGRMNEAEHAIEHFETLCAQVRELAARHDYDLELDGSAFSDYVKCLDCLHRDHFEIPVSDTVRFMIIPIFQEHKAVMDLIRPEGVAKLDFVPGRQGPCNYAGFPAVTANGDVFLCAGVPFEEQDIEEVKVGTVTSSRSLKDVVRSETFQLYNERIKSGQYPCDYCHTCDGSYQFRKK